MKANELRIGNYVNHNSETIQIQSIISTISAVNMIFYEISGDRNSEIGLENIQPIPLTEEWLLKFGFKESNATGYNGCYNVGLGYYVQFMANAVTLFKETDDNKLILLTGFEYVHQLQNLYFALTGEELTI